MTEGQLDKSFEQLRAELPGHFQNFMDGLISFAAFAELTAQYQIAWEVETLT